jgi:DNA-binding SARP family transcriptional activator
MGPNDTISDHEKKRIEEFMKAGLTQLQEIDDIKSSLSDLAKALAEELGVKPAVLNKALKTAFKQTLEGDKEQLSQVEEILAVTGRA